MMASKIVWLNPSKKGEIPEKILNKHTGVSIGTGNYKGRPEQVYITDNDRQTMYPKKPHLTRDQPRGRGYNGQMS
jgi:hypothetical protein